MAVQNLIHNLVMIMIVTQTYLLLNVVDHVEQRLKVMQSTETTAKIINKEQKIQQIILYQLQPKMHLNQ